MVFLINLLKKLPPVPTVLFLLRDSAPEPSEWRLYFEVGLLIFLIEFPFAFALGWYLGNSR